MNFIDSIPFGEQFSLRAEQFEEMAVTNLPLSIRVFNRFKSNHICTVADLLATTPEALMKINGLGRNSIEEIKSILRLLPQAPSSEKNLHRAKPESKSLLITANAESIVLGDFSFSDGMELSDEENRSLSVYKNGIEMIGADLALECYCNPERITPIISMLNRFCDESQRLFQLRSIAEAIPSYRRQNRAVGYIRAFPTDDSKKQILLSLCPSDVCTLDALTNIVLPENSQELRLLQRFLQWCSFDLNSEMEELFRRVYVKERAQAIIQMRARAQTLEQAGSVFGITRERVRQIEVKAKRLFAQYDNQIRIVAKIMAEENATVLTSAEIGKYCKANADELLYLLRSCENSYYRYDGQRDLFVLGNTSVRERVHSIAGCLQKEVLASTEPEESVSVEPEVPASAETEVPASAETEVSASAETEEPQEMIEVPLKAFQDTVEIQPNWIRYDFTNAQDFAYTYPVGCSIAGTPIEGKNWVRILVAVTERELAKHNPAMNGLYNSSLIAEKKDHPYLMKERPENLYCIQLSNGYWVCVNYNTRSIMEMIRALCLRCGYTKDEIVLYGIPKTSTVTRKRKFVSSGNGIPIEEAESYLRSAGLRGATVKELIQAVQPGAAVSLTAAALEGSPNLIVMPGNRYVHADSFVDLDEAEEILDQILQTHFAQFGGYSNQQLLFGAASRELSMFLNDNDCENTEAVYAIARYLFEKKAKRPYKFSQPHIFEKEPDYPMSLRGLMIHLARDNDGLLSLSDAKDYLQKALLNFNSIGQLFQIKTSNTFLIYDGDRYLLSETLGIDDDWCTQMHNRLDDLFRKANVAYVIPRDINTAWLKTLPELPQDLEWTRLLLQEVLDKYPAIGFKSISPNLNQAYDTLAAAFVPAGSPLQTFPDVVTLFMEEHHDLPLRMSGENLRRELRDAGMLENNEMISSLPKALNDYRFAWSNENKTVYVRGNQ